MRADVTRLERALSRVVDPLIGNTVCGHFSPPVPHELFAGAAVSPSSADSPKGYHQDKCPTSGSRYK